MISDLYLLLQLLLLTRLLLLLCMNLPAGSMTPDSARAHTLDDTHKLVGCSGGVGLIKILLEAVLVTRQPS